jgi:putative ubiquitin-RnfH superfamily antitoxin RatB of RatAB toxin-antitoxin module
MRITVARCLAARQVQEFQIDLPEGARASQALQACGIGLQDGGAPDAPGWLLGIWGRRCTPAAALQDGDRLEVYRPLRVDPKVARRERFKGQGARTAGLFAKRRPGAKPGY